MIRFACVYCGAEVVVEDTQAGKLSQCPACSHMLRVLRRRRPPGAFGTGSRWRRMSNQDIADTLLTERPGETAMGKVARQAASPFLPKYDDLTLFTLSAALLLLLWARHDNLTAGELKRDAEWIAKIGPRVVGHLIILVAIAGVGMVASLFGVFFERKKPQGLKFAMLCFAVFITSATGIYAGYIALKTAQSWWMMIFPLWNIVNGVFLLLMLRAGVMDEEYVTDEHPPFRQVVLTLICVGIILGVCHFIFELHWTITYSICVCYTMTLNRTLTNLFRKCAPPV